MMYAPWLVQGRYFDWWKSLGHRVVRWARPDDGDLPVALNGDKEWAVPISKAVKAVPSHAGAVEAPEEATSPPDAAELSAALADPPEDAGPQAATEAPPPKRKRGRPRKHAVR